MERLTQATFSDSGLGEQKCRGMERWNRRPERQQGQRIAMVTDRETDGQKKELVCQQLRKHYPTLVTHLPHIGFVGVCLRQAVCVFKQALHFIFSHSEAALLLSGLKYSSN